MTQTMTLFREPKDGMRVGMLARQNSSMNGISDITCGESTMYKTYVRLSIDKDSWYFYP